MKKVLLFLVMIIFSLIMGLVIPYYINNNIAIENINSTAILNQSVKGYSDSNVLNYKIYNDDKLIGIVTNKNKLYENIKNYNFNTDVEYDKSKIGLKENIYIVEELSKVIYEDIDSDILDYLINNECIGVESMCVKFSRDKGVYDIIYISNEEDFINARDQFVLNFISQDSLNKINRNDKIDSPISQGSVDMGISVKEKMEISKGITLPSEIFQSTEEIYEYLCYGRNTERQYYTTLEGDTLASVGRSFKGMSAKQVMMLNSNVIKDENQILEAGTVLNVTYYTSPLTITVTKERFAVETVYPDPIEYIEDSSLLKGASEVVQEEKNGFRNVLYKETWLNGVRQESLTETLSYNDISVPQRGIVHIGIGSIIPSGSTGSGNWRWPVSNPLITCDYYCYAGHGGVDFYNLYNPWDYVLAIDSGTVIDKGWTDLGGYYARIDHNNGYITYYGHFSSLPIVEVGQSVSAGQVLGSIGMTGYATGPHVHLAMYDNGIMVNPCSVLDCSLLY